MTALLGLVVGEGAGKMLGLGNTYKMLGLASPNILYVLPSPNIFPAPSPTTSPNNAVNQLPGAGPPGTPRGGLTGP